MTTNQSSIAKEARTIFESIRESLEASHLNEFVTIEPISGRHFLGKTLSDAIGSARQENPERLVHTFRIGHNAAVHFGLQIR